MLFLLKKINIKSFFYFFIIFAIYISFYIKTHTMYGQDTFDFINWAEKGIALPLEFNCSRHIAYTSLTYLFFKIWVFFGWKQGAIVPLQLMSALFGAGGVLVFYNILKGLFSSKKFCFIGSLFFAFSYGPVIWTLLSEIYPTNIRGRAMSIATLSLWTGTFIIGQMVPWMFENLKTYGTFWFFAVMCIPALYIVIRLTPETKGKTLEEIERYWLARGKVKI